MKRELGLLQTTKCPQSHSKFAINVPLPKRLFAEHQPHRQVTSSTYANQEVPIPVVARSKAVRLRVLRFRIPSKSFTSSCCVLFIDMQRQLRRADHLSGGDLPSVECVSVIVKPVRGDNDPEEGRRATQRKHYCSRYGNLIAVRSQTFVLSDSLKRRHRFNIVHPPCTCICRMYNIYYQIVTQCFNQLLLRHVSPSVVGYLYSS